jgi:hypothetical protein
MPNTTPPAASVACVLVLFAAALPACDTDCSEADSATCFPAPNDLITAFEVTITTGNDPTTSDIFFCFARKSAPGWDCREMDNGELYNDFSIGATDRYRFELSDDPVAPGDLEQFRIGMDSSDYHHDWNLTALTVVVQTPGDHQYLIYTDDDIDCGGSIDEGKSYFPRSCPY